MSHSFIAYIDESGDDGFSPAKFRQPGHRGGSSRWLIVSATVMRARWGDYAVPWRNELLSLTGKQSRHLHFTDLTHGQRLAVCQFLSQKPLRAISVLSNKETIAPGTFASPNQYYWFLTRYVIERLSWLCRDNRVANDGDGSVKIIFSRRGRMSYEDFGNYLRHMQTNLQTTIHWPSIDIDAVESRVHSKSAALQLCDTIASAMAQGVECDEFQNCEPRYAERLKRIIYHRANNYFSYGVKIVPNIDGIVLSAEQQSFINIFR